jgi:hypothetical protein
MAFRIRLVRHCKTWLFLAGVCSLPLGCVPLGSLFSIDKPNGPPVGSVHQVHATWQSGLTTTQDVVHGGSPLKGLTGCLYFFGQEVGHPLRADGEVIVNLYDIGPSSSGGQPKLLEQWQIDKETLGRLARKDVIGWGYNIFLPVSNLSPEVRQASVQVRYMPEKGAPLLSPPALLSFRGPQTPTVHITREAPGSALAPAATPAQRWKF